MPRQRQTLVIRRAEQLASLSSPVRSRIVESLSVHGPSSVREIAERLGRLPESLYYHLRPLVEVGIVVLKEKQTNNGFVGLTDCHARTLVGNMPAPPA